MRTTRTFGVLTILLLTGTAAAAETSPDPDAHELLERGVEHYEAGRYPQAIQAFRAGYERDAQPAFLYAWAQAERQNGNCERAVPLYEQFLAAGISEAQRAAAEQNLRRCRAELPSEAAPSIPSPPVGPPSPAAPAPAPAPSPRSPGGPDAAANSPLSIDDSPWYTDTFGGVLSVTGIAAIAVGAGFLVSSASHQADAEADSERVSGRTYGEHVESMNAAARDRVIGFAALGSGGVLLTLGVVRYLTRATGPTPSVGILPDGTGVHFVGQSRF